VPNWKGSRIEGAETKEHVLCGVLVNSPSIERLK
jgi:hypothetical protein